MDHFFSFFIHLEHGRHFMVPKKLMLYYYEPFRLDDVRRIR